MITTQSASLYSELLYTPIFFILFILECDHVGPIYTVRYQDQDENEAFNQVKLEIVGLGRASQHFVIENDEVKTNSSLRLNCDTNYELIIRATDNGGTSFHLLLSY